MSDTGTAVSASLMLTSEARTRVPVGQAQISNNSLLHYVRSRQDEAAAMPSSRKPRSGRFLLSCGKTCNWVLACLRQRFISDSNTVRPQTLQSCVTRILLFRFQLQDHDSLTTYQSQISDRTQSKSVSASRNIP